VASAAAGRRWLVRIDLAAWCGSSFVFLSMTGAGLMRFHHGVCLLLGLGLLFPLAGCKAKKERETGIASTSSTGPGTGEPFVASTQKAATEKDPNAGLSGLARVWSEPEIRNRLQNLGLAYHTYTDSNNRAPSKAEDLAPYYEKNRDITEALEKGWITFYYNVKPLQMREGTSNTILAFETDPDARGMRWILRGDGGVEKVSQQVFDQMPKAKMK